MTRGQTYVERVGNLHIHSLYSDGSGSYEVLLQAAAEAGLDFLLVTDHDVCPAQEAGWRNGLLCLVGEEIHDPEGPEENHLLAFAVGRSLAHLAGDPQAVIDAIHEAGGLAYLAHPFEHSPRFSGEPEINWTAWGVEGYDGLEVWNYMSEFKSYIAGPLRALLYVLAPKLAIRGPFRETLQKWDTLLADHRVTVVGGSDAHAAGYRVGRLRLIILPYALLFRGVNQHLLIDGDWQADLETDAGLVYDALRTGRGFVGYDALAPTRGFRFLAYNGVATACMGQELALDARGAELTVIAPRRGQIRLINQGRTVCQARGRQMRCRVDRPGAYRVEVRRFCLARWRTWIVSNPIWLT